MTEAAALAAARMVGRGDKEGADQAAVDAMRHVLDSVSMDGVVVIGEGEKDNAPMLFNGEQIGDGTPPLVDIAVDPLEGTRLTALGMPSAISVIALAERGTMFNPGPIVYMEKIAGGPEIADLLDLDRPLPETLALIAERKRIDIRDVMVVMLDRERHHDAMAEIREAGARVRLILDGDVVGGAARGLGQHAGRPAVGDRRHARGRDHRRGDQVHRWRAQRPAVAAQRRGADQAAIDAGYDLERVLSCDDLVGGEDVFFSATGRHRRRRAPGRSLPGRPRRDDRVAGDAVAVGDRPARVGAPRPRRSCGR